MGIEVQLEALDVCQRRIGQGADDLGEVGQRLVPLDLGRGMFPTILSSGKRLLQEYNASWQQVRKLNSDAEEVLRGIAATLDHVWRLYGVTEEDEAERFQAIQTRELDDS